MVLLTTIKIIEQFLAKVCFYNFFIQKLLLFLKLTKSKGGIRSDTAFFILTKLILRFVRIAQSFF